MSGPAGNWPPARDGGRPVATAILGDPSKTTIAPISRAQRWPVSQSGEVDMLIKTSGTSLPRDAGLGLRFSLSWCLATIMQ